MCLLEESSWLEAMQGNSLFFLFQILSEIQPSQAFDYSNNLFKEHPKVCLNATTKFLVQKIEQEITVNPLPRIILHFRKP